MGSTLGSPYFGLTGCRRCRVVYRKRLGSGGAPGDVEEPASILMYYSWGQPETHVTVD